MTEIRVNIVEDKRWQEFADNASEWSSDSASHEFGSMEPGDVENLLDQILSKGGIRITRETPFARKRWIPKSEVPEITHELVRGTAEAILEGHPDLEATRFFILDAMTWAWEEAYLPDDGDIKSAMNRIVDTDDIDFPYDHSDLFDEFFDSEGHKKEGELAAGLAANVKLVREPGYYDCYFVFSWRGAWSVEAFLRFHVRRRRKAERALDEIMPAFARNYMEAFYRNLEKEMQPRTEFASNRVDFRRQWKNRLEDAAEVKNVVDELVAYWRTAR